MPESRPEKLACFKAYDIRGKVPDELDFDMAYAIGRAYAAAFRPNYVVVGRDVRLTSEKMADAVTRGLTDSGCDVYDIGLCGTEQVYFSTAHLGASGGIMVTASHNPADYNGMKFVREGSRPISADTGLKEMEALVVRNAFPKPGARGTVKKVDTTAAYTGHVLGYVNTAMLTGMKVVANSGNGCAGPVVDMLAARLPVEFVRVHHEPDGTFPNGVPNPLLPENREATSKAVVESGADIGVAWDGDFDRCFLFDEKGGFVEGYYMVGLLARAMLMKNPGSHVVHDPRLTWNTVEVVNASGGRPVMCKAGHAFIKEKMRASDAVYGGEMSAHHYFRKFFYCDSGMIPWLLALDLIARSKKPLSELVGEMERRYPVSGEINREISDPKRALEDMERRYGAGALKVDRTDGLSFEYADWRFNVRMSNTEPLVRLNVETRADRALLAEKTKEILSFLERY